MSVTSNRTKTLGRGKAQREALIRSLTIALFENKSIETTLPKAKATRPYAEKLITKAKKGTLHSRRQVIGSLHSVEVSNMLFDEIAPNLKDRDSGYLRIVRTTERRGDNAQLATISFVDDVTKTAAKPAEKKAKKPAKSDKKTEDKKAEKKPAKTEKKTKKDSK